jgi:hypothetical protein
MLIRFLIGTTFCSTLLWFLLPYVESNFSDYLFLGFTICVGLVSMLWNLITTVYDRAVARARAINTVSKQIDIMMKSGMTTDEIMTTLEFKRDENENVNGSEEDLDEIVDVKTVKIQYDPLTEICGYFNGEPIYNRIKLSNGRIAVFDGVHDMKRPIDPSKLKESTMILESGIIYTLEK